MGYPERGKKKKKEERERENFPAKSSNLSHYWACSQNKGLSEYQRRVSQLWTSPSLPEAGRQESDSQSGKTRGKLGPRDSIPYQSASRLPVAKQVFLVSWTVDIHQEGCSQRSVPQKRHTAHLSWCTRCAPRKPSSWDVGCDKMHRPAGKSALSSHLVT